jgi:hypothetical protein
MYFMCLFPRCITALVLASREVLEQDFPAGLIQFPVADVSLHSVNILNEIMPLYGISCLKQTLNCNGHQYQSFCSDPTIIP